ncbi:uncharacterized protein [Dysidea avara]|uniref:uncharacterized protein n=1 Tax=Dysidea avara TaxID=196820 RepID=UPI003319BA11
MIFAVILVLLTSVCICGGQQPSVQCRAANTTLMNDADCHRAYLGFLFGVGLGADTDQSFFDQVCKEGTCRSEILEFQNSCAGIEDVDDAVASIAFGCIPHEMAGSCLNVSIDNEGGLLGFILTYLIGDVGVCLRQFYTGMCSEGCKQNVTRFVNQWGCCYAELIRLLAQEPDEFSPVHYGVSVRDYFTFCDLPVPTFCMDGPTPPPNQCAMAIRQVFSSDDLCTTTWRQLIAGNSSNDSITTLLRTPGCAERLQNYVTTCEFFDSENTISLLLQLTAQFGNVINHRNGQRCSAGFPGVFDALSLTSPTLQPCFTDLGIGMCSNACKQFLTESVRSYGCCFNEGARIYYTAEYPDDDDDDEDDDDDDDDDDDLSGVFQAITVTLYALCGIQSPGFCTQGPTAPPLSPCESAGLSLFGQGDSCGTAVQAIFELEGLEEEGGNVSFTEVDKMFGTLCSTPRCRQRLINYFTACVEDDDDPQQAIRYYTDFGCRRNDMGSCFALLATNTPLRALQDGDACESVVDPVNPSCSSNCTQVVQAAVDATGCCSLEFTYVGLSSSDIIITPEQAYAFCSVTNPGRCVLQAAAATGAAITDTANVLLVSILLLLISLII